MSSFGESDITINATRVGTVRVLSANAGASLFPRLLLRVGVHLQRLPNQLHGLPSIDAFELRELRGELRLKESSAPICAALPIGHRRPVRFSGSASETQLELVCDLDYQRLERLEEYRDGGIPRVWLALWPWVFGQDGFVDAEIHPFELRIPRDVWLDFLRETGSAEFELLEIRYPSGESGNLARAVGHLRDARSRIASGDFVAAAADCRKVLEAALADARSDSSGGEWPAILATSTDERRGPEYAKIAGGLKQLSGFAHHDFGSDVMFTRADALFLVRATHAFLVLVAHLNERHAAAPAP